MGKESEHVNIAMEVNCRQLLQKCSDIGYVADVFAFFFFLFPFVAHVLVERPSI